MARHVHIHMHPTRDSWEEGKHPRAGNGQFGRGGSGHNTPARHLNEAEAHGHVKERRAGLEASGFKHEKSEGSPTAVLGHRHHLAHPDGARAVVTHKEDSLTGRHAVHSQVNETNAGKKGPAPGEFGSGSWNPAPAKRPPSDARVTRSRTGRTYEVVVKGDGTYSFATPSEASAFADLHKVPFPKRP